MTNTRRERAIALRSVEIINQQLMEILSTVRADMSTVKGQISNVEQTLTNMNGRIGVLATTSTNTISAIDSLARTPLAAPVRAELTVAAPVVISNHEPTREESNAVYKPKLSLRTPENILANNLKPRWDTNVAFNKSPNREIAKRLLSNLERRFGSSSMRRSDLQKRLHTNFTSRTHCKRMSDDEIAETNALTQRAARADDMSIMLIYINECHRVLAYKDNKEAIDLVMLRDCANTLQKAVMSDGESANEIDEDGIKHVIHIVQPGWRSDECNRFIALVDTYAVQAMGSSANQRIRRITTSVSNSAVLDNISPNFPWWALRDGL
ncbi:hypothetical protein PHYBLDRAFT_175748 [Phycomyces blakesleeanus NRRL 1555(-)]|uniref:Homeodomain-like DNA binding domain-containing transcription factor n=1 Tax=Phycomyces blakesleeanus (strain ATCC 8743b / DSM 1359 / FGSC 10004 / NBRC 33097 / NRRL 1555) TaxID=763407 RepID=A0A167JDQ1_PHYB8|nr:hypothetical protein PHYBLDRAFT_175748 [Phycomyces blakesleeanus NRRL 1555(-)]OAD65786.1 hypothetical protein PHYBLDRAFT_175748 [Phycomyces blakesleeanus NRRL 1555(-)]|eukprot:XP_018283826.1 hypothetical protein PHYBLDRAFT_175748 [Phycomyces blakesleeanus NRRL 1555(-)]